MNGLMMDFQLTLPTAPAAGRDVLPRQADRDAAARPELPPLHLPRDGAPREAARGRRCEARARARRPRRDALLEPLPAPRGVLRDPVRRLRAAHAQPAPAPERPRLHRDARRGPRRDRRPQPPAAARAVPRPDADRARARRRGLLRGAARGGEPPTSGSTPSSTRTRRRRCATRAARPGRPKGVVYSHRSTILHTLGVASLTPLGDAVSRAGHDPAGRADVPRERVGLPVSRGDARREPRLPRARTSTPRACSTRSSRSR